MITSQYLDLLRQSVSAELWSKAVKVARKRPLADLQSHALGAQALVFDETLGRSFKAELFFDDQDWLCNCDGEDPCLHVLTLAIAMRQIPHLDPIATSSPAQKSKAVSSQAVVEYHFWQQSEGLKFERYARHQRGKELILSTLSHFVAQAPKGIALHPQDHDYRIEQALQQDRRGVLQAVTMQRILPLLAGLGDQVFLDGETQVVCAEALSLELNLSDQGSAVQMQVSLDRRIIKSFRNGAVLSKVGLHPAGTLDFGADTSLLQKQRVLFSGRQLDELECEILPRLQSKIKIINQSRFLGLAEELPLLWYFDLQQKRGKLELRARLAYGRPPAAVISNGAIQMLNSKEQAPIRNDSLEKKMIDELWQRHRLECDQPAMMSLEEAQNFLRKARGATFRDSSEASAHFAGPLWNGLLQPVDLDIAVAQDDQGQWQAMLGLKGGAHGRTLGTSEEDLIIDSDHRDPTGELGSLESPPWSLEEVVDAWKKGLRWLVDDRGRCFSLPNKQLDAYGTFWQEWARQRKSGQSAQQLLEDLQDSMNSAEQGLKAIDADVDLKNLEEQSAFGAQAPLASVDKEFLAQDSPEETLLQASLRPYQKEGLRWMLWHKKQGQGGVILADDMGLGKTIQAMGVIQNQALIVCPTSLLYNWQRELQTFRPDLDVQIYHGAQRHQMEFANKVTITTYAILRLDQGILADHDWPLFICDEIQNLRNHRSQAWQAAKAMQHKFCIGLSGTPIENRLLDLWSLSEVVRPSYWGSATFFKKHWQQGVSAGKADVFKFFQSKVAQICLRRRKADVLDDLPEKQQSLHVVELDEQQRLGYQSIQKALLEQLEQLKGQSKSAVFAVLPLLLKLRQQCCHPHLIAESASLPLNEGAAKLEYLLEKLESLLESRSKVLIFSQWTAMLDLIEDQVKRRLRPQWSPSASQDQDLLLRIDGGTTQRQQIVDRFQNPNGPPLLLMSLKAGGVGLNLTAADHVFLFEPWWNPATEFQAEDRAHRIGRKQTVVIHRLIAKDTIEEKILQLQEQKRDLAERAFAQEAGGGGQLSNEDLDFLLSSSR